ncbi:MAG TPA: hypothetical protein VF158_15210 [Longimicrobiales bacterium]
MSHPSRNGGASCPRCCDDPISWRAGEITYARQLGRDIPSLPPKSPRPGVDPVTGRSCGLCGGTGVINTG